jgi:hypothetical protein
LPDILAVGANPVQDWKARGQAGGLRPDENRSNIYKLYRASRCGPDTEIDPADQLAFYDAGLGSQPRELHCNARLLER